MQSFDAQQLEDASEETLRQMLQDSQRRVSQLARKLVVKDRECAACSQQLEQLRALTAGQSVANVKFSALDPAVGVALHRLRKDLAECKERLEQTQNDLSAWKFTPDSQTGKRLMARIRQMQQENSELSRGVSSGSVAKLGTEIALQKALLQDMRRTQTEQEEFLTEIDAETESLQATVVQLQAQLTDAYSRIHGLEIRVRATCGGPGQSAAAAAAAAAASVAAIPSDVGGVSGYGGLSNNNSNNNNGGMPDPSGDAL